MAIQNYKNHIRYYPAHHFIFYPVILILVITAVYKAIVANANEKAVWIYIACIIFIIGWLSYMMRQHYALTLQNRLVRLEFRQKFFLLTGEDFEPHEHKISFSQIAALRFASDEELLALLKKTLDENLSPDMIKKSIKNWKPDTMRV